jgi:hypothetical protein
VLIFLSYAKEDRSFVEDLAAALVSAGHNAWFDRQLTPGQIWKAELEGQIATCDQFIYVMTIASLSSSWCLWELSVANRMGKPIIPIRLRSGGATAALLQRIQYVDMTSGNPSDGLVDLLRGMDAARPSIVDHSLPIEPPEDGPPPVFYKKHWTDGLVRQQFTEATGGEQVLLKVAANRLRGLNQVGGRLTLTDRRLLFEAHSFNFQDRRLEIPLKSIAETPHRPSGLTIRTQPGENHRFYLWRRRQLLELLRLYSD